MGRTIPSFRTVLEMEKDEWKPFRNALDKKAERKEVDEMWDIPRLYTSACSNSVHHVRLYPILMSTLLYQYKQFTECISEVERVEVKIYSSKKGQFDIKVASEVICDSGDKTLTAKVES